MWALLTLHRKTIDSNTAFLYREVTLRLVIEKLITNLALINVKESENNFATHAVI